MWKVSVKHAGEQPSEVSTRPIPDGANVAPIAASMNAGKSSASQLLAQESDASDAQSFTAIEAWAKHAEEASKEMDWAGAPRLEAVDGGIARYPYADGSGGPACVAWHDRDALLIHIPDDKATLEVEYLPGRADEQRMKRMLYRYGEDACELETLIEWRAYAGHRTGVVDGWTSMRQSGRGYVASFVGVSGFVVARALRRFTTPEPTLRFDSRRQSRLEEQEAANSAVADTCPRLDEVDPPMDTDTAIVFVHGTASCGIAGLKDLLRPPAVMPCPVIRFEHDTFVPIIENVRDLVAGIESRLRVCRLLLVAHSRGGLVAVDAAKVLRDRGYAADITVCSFGTPYQGTPLVAMGKKAINLMMKMGEGIADGFQVPLLSPLAKAMFYLTESPTLPAGIMAMHEAAEALPYIRRNAEGVRLLSWGSDYDILGGSGGYGVAADGFLLGALQRPHDLVVTATSATACGRPQPHLACGHGQYFRQQLVQAAIRSQVEPIPVMQPDTAAALKAVVVAAGAGETAREVPVTPSPTGGVVTAQPLRGAGRAAAPASGNP